MSGVGKENIWKNNVWKFFNLVKTIYTQIQELQQSLGTRHKEKYNKYAMVKVVKMSDKKGKCSMKQR